MNVRPYKPSDYAQLVELYKDSELYGGQFDANRVSEDRLRHRIEDDPNAILVAERNGEIIGTVSLIEDGCVAWLFRFAVKNDENRAALELCSTALAVLKTKGHKQVLVYAPINNHEMGKRYEALGFAKGNDYTCYWKDME